MANRTYLVTGASGFVGAAVSRSLIERGDAVLGVVRSKAHVPADLNGSGRFTAVELDMQEYASLANAVNASIDAVFHFAWQAPWGNGFFDWRTQLANVEATCVLAEQAVQIGARRLVFSGTYNQWEAVELACARGASPRPTTVYSAAKLSADLLLKTLCAQSGIECLSGLVAMAYGPGDRSNKLTNVVVKQLLAGETPRLIPENIPYDCIYIDDVVRAFLAIADTGVPGTAYYIGHERIKTFGWWMRTFRDVVAPGAKLDFGAYPYAGGVDFSKVDTMLLHRDTGFTCDPDVVCGIRLTAQSLKTLGGGQSREFCLTRSRRSSRVCQFERKRVVARA